MPNFLLTVKRFSPVVFAPEELILTIYGRRRGLVVRVPRSCNPEVQGSSPTLTTWILFANPRPRSVNSQLVCLPLVGIFNKYYVQFTNLVESFTVSPMYLIL